MKATELRLGNLVYSCKDLRGIKLPDEFPLRILKISSYECEVLRYDINPATVQKYHRVINSYIEPILLTEQWLLNFGLLECGIQDGWVYYMKNDWSFIKSYKNDKFIIDLGSCDIDVKYVHQLQNIYYALTGEELNVF